ncbi:MAG TPA: type II toxin-antitoxin system PemK/MazF family toxin [Solirubrobacterales bacterium]|nr:type II toxin-antitoxin system PemK/MazF family toxin [Solirubrobacterales bacterium]
MSADTFKVKRGEVYLADPDPVVGHEQGGRRPHLVISVNQMNRSAAGLLIGVPLTTTDRGSKLHVRLEPPEGGLNRVSFAMPEMARSVSTARLLGKLGYASPDAVESVAKRVGILIGLGRGR